jgi:hypothetical protein
MRLMPRSARRWLHVTGSALAIATMAVPALPAGPASATPLATSGTWFDVQGANSRCEQSSGTGVTCTHYAHAGGSQALTSTCQTESVVVGPVAVVGACQVTLTGTTSGAGKVIGEDGYAPGCETSGFGAATVTFSDSTGVSYPPVPVDIVNFEGNAQFSGQVLNGAGIVVAHTEGSFTLACGSPSSGIYGTFEGTYETA